MEEKSGALEEPVSTSDIPFRGNGRARVLDVAKFAAKLQQVLKDKNGLKDGDPFTSAELALEMIEGVQSVGFRLNAKDEDSGGA